MHLVTTSNAIKVIFMNIYYDANKIYEAGTKAIKGAPFKYKAQFFEMNHLLETAILLQKLKNGDVVKALDGLPPVKLHCSVLAEEAIHEAIADYYRKEGKLSEEEIKIKCNLKEHHCESCGI